MMQSETKQCQNCKKDFIIESDDFAFYEKIGVTAPTWCYLCRFQRRGTYRNQMNLYFVKCSLCSKQTLTMYAPRSPFPVYCQECWWSDKWDPLSFGKEYDFSKPFFVQYRELLERTPRLALSNVNIINSEYCNYTANNKNCYLCLSTGSSEDCLYTGPNCIGNKTCVNCATTVDSEQSYSLIDCRKCHTLHYSQNSENCLNSVFLFNCRGCTDCLGCVNLRNKKYHIFNQPYLKEEYEQKLKEYNFGSYKNLVAFQKQFQDFLGSQIHRFMQVLILPMFLETRFIIVKIVIGVFQLMNLKIVNSVTQLLKPKTVMMLALPTLRVSYPTKTLVLLKARVANLAWQHFLIV